MWGNCWDYAIKRFLNSPDGNGYLQVRLTRKSYFKKFVAPHWFRMLVGTVIILPAVVLLNIGLYLIFLRWTHVAFGENQDGRYIEFIPNDGPIRLVPPLFFRGRIVAFNVCKHVHVEGAAHEL